MRRPRRLVYFDPDAAQELAAVRSKAELKAIDVVVEKLRDLGESLRPPHMKPLRGLSLRELRVAPADREPRLVVKRVRDRRSATPHGDVSVRVAAC